MSYFDIESRADSSGLSEIKALISQTLKDIALDIEEHRTGNCEEQLESIIQVLIDEMFQVHSIHDDVITLITQSVQMLKNEKTTNRQQPKKLKTHLKGRPPFEIMKETLLYFIENGFSVEEIACIINVSSRTIFRRLQHYGLSLRQTFCQMSDAELDDIVTQKVLQFPNSGYRTIYGHLLSEGIKVQQVRVQESVKRVDPCGVAVRKLFMQHYRVRRRRYNVSAPMSLWHVDTNHKLIRWRFVLHAGIDGFSRLPTYAVVASDNTAATALQAFVSGVSQYGLPERVRSDKGKENVGIAEYMLEHRGMNNNSHITGRSVHNQRIERFWREVWQGCTSSYYHLFYLLEEEGLLNVDSEIDILSLHLVYLERLQLSLTRFCKAVSRRPLRTENNRSPLQLWIMGQVLNPYMELSTEDALFYGIDFDGPTDMTSEEDIVVPSLFSVPGNIIDLVNGIKQMNMNDNYFEYETYCQVKQYLCSVYSDH